MSAPPADDFGAEIDLYCHETLGGIPVPLWLKLSDPDDDDPQTPECTQPPIPPLAWVPTDADEHVCDRGSSGVDACPTCAELEAEALNAGA